MGQQQPRIEAAMRADELAPIVNALLDTVDRAFGEHLRAGGAREQPRGVPPSREQRIAAPEAVGGLNRQAHGAGRRTGVAVMREPIEKYELPLGRPAAGGKLGGFGGGAGSRHDSHLRSENKTRIRLIMQGLPNRTAFFLGGAWRRVRTQTRTYPVAKPR